MRFGDKNGSRMNRGTGKGSGKMSKASGDEIKIGILFSLTGTTGITERGQFQAALLAIRQINARGGVHGKRLVPIVEDISSDPYSAAQKMEKLITKDRVATVVGLYTSACRKMVIPVLEKHDSLLLYPTQYEGEEQHPKIFYCGPLPNQQLLHFIPWIVEHLGRSFYLIGSDYIYPRVTNRHIRHLIHSFGGKIAGEAYVELGGQEFSSSLGEIGKASPDVIFSTLVGDSVTAFYQQHRQYGLPQPIASAITAETEIASIQPPYAAGHYSSFPYFSSVQSKTNEAFVTEYRRAYGSENISSAMENAYNCVNLLAEAIRRVESSEARELCRALPGISLDAPQGRIMMDRANRHLWLNARIGKVNEAGQFTIIQESGHPIAPIPFFEDVTLARPRQNTGTGRRPKAPTRSDAAEAPAEADPSMFRQLLADISDHLQDGLFVLRSGKTVFENRSARELLLSGRELIRKILEEAGSGQIKEPKALTRRDSTGNLVEVSVIDSDPYQYVYIKPLQSNAPREFSGGMRNLLATDLVGRDEKFLNALSLAKSASRTNANVLILGESGTGKELFARAIHNESRRRDGPFVALNCAAIPRDLVSAELFGYVEGAFTGAKKGGAPGKFELADGGTLFLDEIGDMPLDLQATLLRVLQEREVTRVGGQKPIPVDVRIIAATNKNITQEIAYKGSFRSDLYFRLNVFTIELAPLRERVSDIPELSAHFLREIASNTGLSQKHLTADALQMLCAHSWPGNVRELHNVIERACHLADPSPAVTCGHLPQYMIHPKVPAVLHEAKSPYDAPPPAGSPAPSGPPADAYGAIRGVREIKRLSGEQDRDFFIQALFKNRGNISHTAKQLGISRTTLYRRLDALCIKTTR